MLGRRSIIGVKPLPSGKARKDEFRAQFEAETLPHMKALYNKAYYLARDAEEASDLVQETYLRAYRTFSNFEPGTNAKAWLFTILYSVFVNRYRREQRAPGTVSLEAAEEHFSRAIAAVDWQAEAAIHENNPNFQWQEPEVTRALEGLPEAFRAAVLLVDVEGFTYEEAADILGCPLGTLRSRLFRARKQLFVALRDYAIERGYIKERVP